MHPKSWTKLQECISVYTRIFIFSYLYRLRASAPEDRRPHLFDASPVRTKYSRMRPTAASSTSAGLTRAKRT